MSSHPLLNCKTCSHPQYNLYRSKLTPVVLIHRDENGWFAHLANGYAKQGHRDATSFESKETIEKLAKKWAASQSIPYIPHNSSFLFISKRTNESDGTTFYGITQVNYEKAERLDYVSSSYAAAKVRAITLSVLKGIPFVENYAVENETTLLVPHICLGSLS